MFFICRVVDHLLPLRPTDRFVRLVCTPRAWLSPAAAVAAEGDANIALPGSETAAFAVQAGTAAASLRGVCGFDLGFRMEFWWWSVHGFRVGGGACLDFRERGK